MIYFRSHNEDRNAFERLYRQFSNVFLCINRTFQVFPNILYFEKQFSRSMVYTVLFLCFLFLFAIYASAFIFKLFPVRLHYTFSSDSALQLESYCLLLTPFLE